MALSLGMRIFPAISAPNPLLTIPASCQKQCRNPEPARSNRTGHHESRQSTRNHGQAVWLDFFGRGFVARGDLKKLIDTDGVKALRRNPSIFEKAIAVPTNMMARSAMP